MILDSGPAVIVPGELAAVVVRALREWLRRERVADPELSRLLAELDYVAAQMADGGRSIDGAAYDWLTVTQAAHRLDVATRTLRRRAADGQIPARRGADGRTWQIAVTTSNEPAG